MNNLKVLTAFSIICIIISSNLAAQHFYPEELLQQYCEKRSIQGLNPCCLNRDDDCSVPISGTLCYCDDFCDRHTNPDCCPDYQPVCRGISPPPNITAACSVGTTRFYPGHTIKDNCNTCKCTLSGQTECEKDVCMIDPLLIDHINQCSSLGWTAAKYEEFHGRKYNQALKMKLGTLAPHKRVQNQTPIQNPFIKLPKYFDSHAKWPGMISDIRDQQWCGSSWVISTTSVASDRYSIKSKGKEYVDFAPQQVLSCERRQQGCHGGHVDNAWQYLRKTGGVDEDCYPYMAKKTVCTVRKGDSLTTAGCRNVPSNAGRHSLFFMGPVYRVPTNETDIMQEIFKNGPVQATMKIYQDFFSYRCGVYRHSAFGENRVFGYHSVRIVGWGEDTLGPFPMKYWIVANSWGKKWGENGFFRILRGTNEAEIESFVLASLPQLSYKKKRH